MKKPKKILQLRLEDKNVFNAIHLNSIGYVFEFGEKLVPVSINLSRADFQMMDPLTELNQAMRKNGLHWSLVRVEITESALSKDVAGGHSQLPPGRL
ncbi:hypothetical protein ME793_19090 [Lactobacillus delbrueckii]|nr:hypothetical protein ME785_19180 [Lactobacillus delbrueckii]GHN38679.1 hypothetical protein ME793_19090 [Lactobacillus delbrueckii]GHN63410.1 hypothetical protein ME807_18170 [Lactobacillus delbrueckii]